MKFLTFAFSFLFLGSIVSALLNDSDIQTTNLGINHISSVFSPSTEPSNAVEEQYILHKWRIDSEIELLKKKQPELKNEIISYKFLFSPKNGSKQFFESDGSIFVILKIYTKHIMPGDMISFSNITYKDPKDPTAELKNFESKLTFVFE